MFDRLSRSGSRARLVFTALAVVLLVTAGCGSTKGAAPAGGTVVIGLNNSDQGNGQDLAYFGNGIQAWANDVNARGGVAGHQIRIDRCNDQASEAGATFCTRQQVQNKDVVAAVGYSPFGGSIQGPTYGRAGVPYMQLGARDKNSVDGSGSALTVDPMSIGAFGGGLAHQFVQVMGKKKIAVIRIDSPSLEYPFTLLKQSVEMLGGTIVADVRHPATTVDFSASVVQAQAAGADAVVGFETTPGYIRLLQAATAQGLRVPFGASGPTLTPDLEKTIAATGSTMVLNAFIADPETSNDPNLVAFRNAMTSSGYAGDIAKAGAVGAWAAGWVLERAIAQIGSGEVSRAALMKVLTTNTLQQVPLFDGPVGRSNGTTQMPALGYSKTYIVTVDAQGRHYSSTPIDIHATLERMRL